MDVQKFAEKLFRLSQVPITVLDKQGKTIFKIPLDERDYGPFELEMLDRVLGEIKTQSCTFDVYDKSVPIGICGCAGTEYDFILGPFAYGKPNNWEVRHFMKGKKIISPVFCKLSDAMTDAEFILEMYGGGSPDREALFHRIIGKPEASVDKLIVEEEMSQYDSLQKNHDYREEEAAMALVSSGNVQWLETHRGALLPSYPVILDDIKKNEEYIAVIAISMAARAAIRGGLTSQEGFLINDIYLKKLSECTSVEQVHAVVEEAIYYCVDCVRRKKTASAANLHVEACKNAMESHKRDKIDLDMIAKECGISKGYMQRLFRENEGISATDYFMNVKIDAARSLLKHSDRSIGEVAMYLGFGSLSYFSDCFKRRTGVSPARYRSANQSKDDKSE